MSCMVLHFLQVFLSRHAHKWPTASEIPNCPDVQSSSYHCQCADIIACTHILGLCLFFLSVSVSVSVSLSLSQFSQNMYVYMCIYIYTHTNTLFIRLVTMPPNSFQSFAVVVVGWSRGACPGPKTSGRNPGTGN